ncbi:MAG: DUF5317 domain-containing protein [Bacillota bacterium]|nr:DUF5317 domain-containing protein [Bacillota bacterium]
MLWEAILLGMAIGWLRGGSYKYLSRVNLVGWPLILLALLLQATLRLDFNYYDSTFSSVYPFLYILSFILLLVFVILQKKQAGIIIFGLGIMLNLLVISANQGRMPVATSTMPAEKAAELDAGTASPFHMTMIEDTPLAFLGDIIPLPYSENKLVSIGDILLGAGTAVYIQQNMRKKKKTRKWRP